MKEEKYIIGIVAIIAVVAVISMIMINYGSYKKTSTTDNIGYAAHLTYPQFEQPINKFIIDKNNVLFSSSDTQQTLTITTNDTAVYSTAYVSINSGAWQQVILSGTQLATSWITGNAQATITIPKTNIAEGTSDENYIIIYSCTKNSTSWDCHNNKWQLQTFNTTKTANQAVQDIPNPYGKTYYLSSSQGNDSNNGTSTSSPWKTINKLNSKIFKPGDMILFKRGDTFYGSIIINYSGNRTAPIIYSAYGTGEKPIITGFTQVTAWTNLGGNIWESTNAINDPSALNIVVINGASVEQISTLSNLNMVTVNGVNTAMGRYPNVDAPNFGYLTYQSTTNVSITSSDLTGTPDWTGAEVVFKSKPYALERENIISQSGSTLFHNSGKAGSNGFGFFIQDDPRTLDQEGEWYYNPTTHKIRVYSASQPTDVKAATINNLVEFTGGWIPETSQNIAAKGSYVTIDNIRFTGANGDAIYVWAHWWTKLHDVKVQNCDFSFTGLDSIYLQAYNMTIENNTISDSNGAGIMADWTQDIIIRNNTVNNIGMLLGMPPAWGALSGISVIHVSGARIEYNTITNVRYDGIQLGGELGYNIANNNYVNGFCLLLTDGGGIYGISNAIVSSNIFVNGYGEYHGTGGSSAPMQANGIYMDDYSKNVVVNDNFAANSSNAGIFLHNAQNVTVANNTAFDNGMQFYSQHNYLDAVVKDHNIYNNIFIAKLPSQSAASFSSAVNDIQSIGNFDNNYYMRPTDDVNTISTSQPSTGSVERTFENWQNYMNQDKNSHRSPIDLRTYQLNSLIGANKFSNGNFTANVAGVSCWTNAGTCTLTWNSNKLNNGTLQASFNKSASIYVPIGAISSSKRYILRYSISGSTDINDTYAFYLRITGPPYSRLTDTIFKRLTSSRTESEIMFDSPVSENNAAIYFDVNTVTGTYNTVWLDNIQLFEADATINYPDDYFRAEYNPTRATKTITLDVPYVDVKNVTYTGTLTLQPYTSIVLIRK